jgi:hypothetical protein
MKVSSECIRDAKIEIVGGDFWTTVTLELDEDGVRFYRDQMPHGDKEYAVWTELLDRFDVIRAAMEGLDADTG